MISKPQIWMQNMINDIIKFHVFSYLKFIPLLNFENGSDASLVLQRTNHRLVLPPNFVRQSTHVTVLKIGKFILVSVLPQYCSKIILYKIS